MKILCPTDFTLVFGGDIRRYEANPLSTKTPFGTAHSVYAGDAIEQCDLFRGALEEIVRLTTSVEPAGKIARNVLKE